MQVDAFPDHVDVERSEMGGRSRRLIEVRYDLAGHRGINERGL